MKASKQRKKARASFKKRRLIRYKTSDGRIWAVDPSGSVEWDGVTAEVVMIRGRSWTRPQCAVRRVT